jgi:hypothetical protein
MSHRASTAAAQVGSESKPSLHRGLDFGELLVSQACKEAHELDGGHGSDVLRVKDAGQEVRRVMFDFKASALSLRGPRDVSNDCFLARGAA